MELQKTRNAFKSFFLPEQYLFFKVHQCLSFHLLHLSVFFFYSFINEFLAIRLPLGGFMYFFFLSRKSVYRAAVSRRLSVCMSVFLSACLVEWLHG